MLDLFEAFDLYAKKTRKRRRRGPIIAVDAARKARFIAAWNSGVEIEDIASRFGISEPTVSSTARRLLLDRRGPRGTLNGGPRR